MMLDPKWLAGTLALQPRVFLCLEGECPREPSPVSRRVAFRALARERPREPSPASRHAVFRTGGRALQSSLLCLEGERPCEPSPTSRRVAFRPGGRASLRAVSSPLENIQLPLPWPLIHKPHPSLADRILPDIIPSLPIMLSTPDLRIPDIALPIPIVWAIARRNLSL